VRTLIEQALFIPATRYVQALRARAMIYPAIVQLFKAFDVIVTPTQPMVAPKSNVEVATFGDFSEDTSSATLRYTAPFNLTGLPALSIPCGFSNTGLPIGLQIVGKPFDETMVLRVGLAYENATPWHKKFPKIE
jgi:aspartyl-tRNA(Asn)/glutamyl-tRNA(Gln) amidotransferase subunit A